MSDQINISVLCFAGLKEIVGSDQLNFSLTENTTCEQFVQAMIEQRPDVEKYAPHLLIARDGQYLDKQSVINDGDELACFPPVSGG